MKAHLGLRITELEKRFAIQMSAAHEALKKADEQIKDRVEHIASLDAKILARQLTLAGIEGRARGTAVIWAVGSSILTASIAGLIVRLMK